MCVITSGRNWGTATEVNRTSEAVCLVYADNNLKLVVTDRAPTGSKSCHTQLLYTKQETRKSQLLSEVLCYTTCNLVTYCMCFLLANQNHQKQYSSNFVPHNSHHHMTHLAHSAPALIEDMRTACLECASYVFYHVRISTSTYVYTQQMGHAKKPKFTAWEHHLPDEAIRYFHGEILLLHSTQLYFPQG